jgi:hypothetical protein
MMFCLVLTLSQIMCRGGFFLVPTDKLLDLCECPRKRWVWAALFTCRDIRALLDANNPALSPLFTANIMCLSNSSTMISNIKLELKISWDNRMGIKVTRKTMGWDLHGLIIYIDTQAKTSSSKKFYL